MNIETLLKLLFRKNLEGAERFRLFDIELPTLFSTCFFICFSNDDDIVISLMAAYTF